MESRVVAVALPLPVQQAFSYRIPEGTSVPERGARVVVPFAGRKAIGVVTGPGESVEKMKDALDVLDEVPLVAPPLLDLAAWMAEHYLAPPGECYRLILPPAGVRASRAMVRLAAAPQPSNDPMLAALGNGPVRVSTLARRLGRDPSAHLARLRAAGAVVLEQEIERPGFRQLQVAVLRDPEAAPKGTAQAEVVRRLKAAGGRQRVAGLVSDKPSLRGAVVRLASLGVIALEDERDVRAPDVMGGGTPRSFEPSADQERVLGIVGPALDAQAFRPFLLHGITGSGKTEVYFRAAERALERGRGSLFLVPEIALTPMLVRAAAARFGATVSVLHSEMAMGERHDQWWRIREGESRVVVGARSALFAPMPDLGLIVVDEEHESAYKQDEAPRYHGRDAAVMRAKLEGAVVILGSATPSLESHANALAGKYERLVLPTRVGPMGLPKVEIVDRRQVMKAGGDPILTPSLVEALRERLLRHEQSLLLLNRRGYATSLLCRECGQQAACPNCSVPLTIHRGGASAECHYCGYMARTATACSACRGEYLRLSGFGTEKVVEAVQAALPKARVTRLDRDLARKRGAVAEALRAFEDGQIDILVGTQMIAKGHDFPNVTLVGVVDADVGLGMPDFRSAERTFQLLTQVAGRAGRGDQPGEVILQSHLPDHYALLLACEQRYEDFFEREIEFRRTMGYPPTTALVNIVVRSEDASRASNEAEALGRALRGGAGYRVLGPARAPLARLRQEHRWQLLLKGRRGAMRDAVRKALVERYGAVRWPGVAVDVDPLTVM